MALVCAFISAGGLGAGIAAMIPILRNILGEEGATLRTLAQGASTRLASAGVTIPVTWVAALPDGRLASVALLIAGVAALTVVGATANFLHSYLSITVATRTTADIRRDAFRQALRMPVLTAAGKTADTVSRLMQDCNALLSGFSALTSKFIAQATKGIVAIVVAFMIDWRLATAAILVSPVFFVVVRKLGKRVRRASRGALRSQAKLLESATETLQALPVIKVYTAERSRLGRFSLLNHDVLIEQLRARTARAMATPLTDIITIVALGGLSLWAASMIINGAMDLSSFVTGLASLAAAGGALKPLSSVVQDVQASSAAAVRISEIFRATTEPTHTRESRAMPILPRHHSSIVFEDIWFSYSTAATPALRNVNLEIRHGETIAFVGCNGCGKTTLLSLVPRIIEPSAGRVLVDDEDIASVRIRSLRRQIGVVTQETVLFKGTIRDNITLGDPWASEDAVLAALRSARAEAFVSQMPGGLDASVGDRGLTLSGGQRQRIAIARALLRNPAILILDEATSMIDAESEHLIGEAFADLAHTRTCLIVAHRLSSVLLADRIVVMEQGAIIDEGKHEQLLDRCETYRLLARSQLIPRDSEIFPAARR